MEERPSDQERRCPVCDAVVAPEATLCRMCGHLFLPTAVADPTPVEPPVTVAESAEVAGEAPLAPPTPAIALRPYVPPPDTAVAPPPLPATIQSILKERPSPIGTLFTAVLGLLLFVLVVLVWQYQPTEMSLALVPSSTPIPPTATLTPTMPSATPLPTETAMPTLTPTMTETPIPTATLQPPRSHTVNSGETLYGLSFMYRVSTESITNLNSLPENAQIQVNQNLLIPWPTATPPLEVVMVEVNGETVVADPRDCNRYEVQSGDSMASIAAQFGIAFDLLILVNRITDATILQPGDTVCIPQIFYGNTADIPPTPGPSPTPTATPPPAGPRLLYPIQETAVDPPDGVLTLQWVAVKALAETEWYMVEMADIDLLDSLPQRGFTRDTSFKVPADWRPTMPETHRLCWRVSIINVTGMRSDGLPLYTFGGDTSQPACFSWLGAYPTATPTPTPTATPTPLPTATP